MMRALFRFLKITIVTVLFCGTSYAQRQLYEIGKDSVDIFLVDTTYQKNISQEIFSYKEKAVHNYVRCHLSDLSNNLQELSNIHLRMEDYEPALDYLYAAKFFAKRSKNEITVAIVDRRLGMIYTEMGMHEQGLKFLNQSFEILEKYKDTHCAEFAKLIRNMGLNYVLQDDYVQAKEYFDESLRLAQKCEMRSELGNGYVNLSGVNTYFEMYDSVLVYLDRALEIFQETGDTLGIGTVYNNRGEYYMQIGDYDKALPLYLDAYEEYTMAREDNFRVSTLRNLSVLYYKLGDYKKAYEYSKRYAAVSQMLLSTRLKRTIENMHASYMQKQIRKSIESDLIISKKQSKIKSYQVYLLSSLLVILLVVLLLYVYHRVSKEKLMKLQLEKEKIAKTNLESQIDFKDRELEGLALNITNKNRFLQDLSKQLDGLNASDSEFKSKVRDVKHLISQYLQSDKELADFNKQVELLQQNFLYALSEEFPDLSENEKQLCVLLRLDISSKDIALMRNVSEKSVHMARYRLRKKMKLESNDNLVDYLKNI